jgi:hypothetical protein
LTARFEAFDTDGDKLVSKEEFEKGVQYKGLDFKRL